MATVNPTPSESSDEARLAAFGLTSEIFHDGLRAGASRAANRSTLALTTSAGTDVYHDGMEDLHRILKPLGWTLIHVEGQPRLRHPDGIVSFTISSGINVGKANARVPRTRKKGKATRNSLAAPELVAGLFDDLQAKLAAKIAQATKRAPFYFLLCERVTDGGSGLILEFAQPAIMTNGGSVNDWKDRIAVPFLALEGDLSVFDQPDDDDGIDVPIEPR